ncbi:MAG: hypothetical protein C0399_07765 [Syntrophus sp. (in: bacteria)]|nr:hypothetical protein [Syntrophus sp. (in: bacteria)]
MVIRLSEIEDTFVVKGSMEASQFMDVENREFHIITPVNYVLTARKFDNLVTLTGRVTLEASFTCGICLEEFSQSVDVDMDIRLTPKAEIPQVPELELGDEDMDVYCYDGDEIDLDPFIYEEVLLNMPLRPICKDDCQGLCAICGKNKNLEICDCHDTSRTLLGEKLKSFLD